jgi:hypothetical protein
MSLPTRTYHQRGAAIMPQGVLPFKYEVEKTTSGMTAFAGLPAYLDLAKVMGLAELADRFLGVRSNSQGWTDGQMIMSLVLLNLSGGDCVEDLKILETDEGLRRILETSLTHGMKRKERRAFLRRWRKQRTRVTPSDSAVFRYLNAFHDKAWDSEPVRGRSWIPKEWGAVTGFSQLNAAVLAFAQHNSPVTTATLDMDATLIETQKRDALHCYKGFKAYQPFNVWWAEQELFVHTEFRAGNVYAGFEQTRMLEEALALLPEGVRQVRVRSDTAGYLHKLLKYCECAGNERFGRIEFAVSCPVDKSFKKSVASAPESAWKPLYCKVNGRMEKTGKEWAEIAHVTDGAGTGKDSPIYRYLATREPLEEQAALPGVDMDTQYPFPTQDLKRGRYKVFGMVSNMDWDGSDLLPWLYERCGKSEHAHGAMKEDLAGGKLPSGRFGANAAWWWISVLAFNLNAIMKGQVLGEEWKPKRMKSIRFHIINIAGRVVKRSRELLIRLGKECAVYGLLLEIRKRIQEMKKVPI